MSAYDHTADSDTEGLMNVETPIERYPLPEATRLILGDNHGLADPERWVAKQLRAGRFRGQKIGRGWFMRDVDIEAAIESLNNVPTLPPDHPPPQSDSPIGTDDVPDILSGLSERSRRRVLRRQRGW
jgi:hypothetical protein